MSSMCIIVATIIVLFSVFPTELELCHSERVTSFTHPQEWLQHCLAVTWCHEKLLLSQWKLCAQFTVSLNFEPLTYGAWVYSCVRPPALWQNGQDLWHAALVTWAWKEYWVGVSTESWLWWRKGLFDFSSAALPVVHFAVVWLFFLLRCQLLYSFCCPVSFTFVSTMLLIVLRIFLCTVH